jgi:hypothetical protein
MEHILGMPVEGGGRTVGMTHTDVVMALLMDMNSAKDRTRSNNELMYSNDVFEGC